MTQESYMNAVKTLISLPSSVVWASFIFTTPSDIIRHGLLTMIKNRILLIKFRHYLLGCGPIMPLTSNFNLITDLLYLRYVPILDTHHSKILRFINFIAICSTGSNCGCKGGKCCGGGK